MIANAQHLTVLDALQREITDLLERYNREANGETDKVTLVSLRATQLDDLEALLARQRRALRHMIGEHVEPQQQFAEAVLTGVGAGSAR